MSGRVPPRAGVVVVGAGPAGLAAAAALQGEGARVVVLDERTRVGDSWAGHYDGLRLNTVAWTSHLPGRRFPRSAGPYPTRDDVVGYLADYATRHGLDVRSGVRVERIERHRPDGTGDGARWVVRSDAGDVVARSVVVATGSCRVPRVPRWAEGSTFGGRVVHSARYRDPRPYRGRRVLVVGAGNSGGEIAAELAGAGAREVLLSVRTVPQTVPRRVLGVPTVLAAIATRHLPAAVGDGLVRFLRHRFLADLPEHGLPGPTRAVSEQYADAGVVPLSHPGFFAALRAGRIDVVPAVVGLDEGGAQLADGRLREVDDVVLATGYDAALQPLLGGLGVLDPRGRPAARRGRWLPGAPGLHAIGFTDPLSGNLREIRLEARALARVWRQEHRRDVDAARARSRSTAARTGRTVSS